jgi:hypothetical protein
MSLLPKWMRKKGLNKPPTVRKKCKVVKPNKGKWTLPKACKRTRVKSVEPVGKCAGRDAWGQALVDSGQVADE